MVKIIKISQNPPIALEDLLSQLKISKKKPLFISDEKIWKNCCKFFDADFLKNIPNLILKNPKADEKNLNKITKAAKNFDFILALGSGTINDLCKMGAANLKIPYAVFASSPSMNGYVSPNASIEIKKHKKTLTAKAPIAVFYNLKILKSSPTNLIKAGIGDSLCFYSCYFDWYLSHLIFKTKFTQKPFDILIKEMDFLVKNYQKFSLKNEEFLDRLMQILLLSGQGMAIAGGSYPASQSEHLIAHALSMKYPKKMAKIFHGNQIAITTLDSAKLQKKLLKNEFLFFKKTEFPLAKMIDFFGKKIALECRDEFLKKELTTHQVNKINDSLKKEWKNYRQKLAKIYFDGENLKNIFFHFDIKTSLAKSTISNQEYQACIACAKFIRNRFTCLDFNY